MACNLYEKLLTVEDAVNAVSVIDILRNSLYRTDSGSFDGEMEKLATSEIEQCIRANVVIAVNKEGVLRKLYNSVKSMKTIILSVAISFSRELRGKLENGLKSTSEKTIW